MSAKSQPCCHSAELKIAADPAKLCQVRDVLREIAKGLKLSEEETGKIILAIDEALTNTIRHGYGGPCCQPIFVNVVCSIDAETQRRRFECVIRDMGKQVDPDTIKGRNLDEIRPGGLGVHIIRSVMDEVEYSCPTEGGMKLKMVKFFEPLGPTDH